MQLHMSHIPVSFSYYCTLTHIPSCGRELKSVQRSGERLRSDMETASQLVVVSQVPPPLFFHTNGQLYFQSLEIELILS